MKLKLKSILPTLLLLLFSFTFSGKAKAQDLAIKTNLLSDATATVSLGAEIGLSPKWTFELYGQYNPWTMPNDMLWRQGMVYPEFKFWFCDRFMRHFLGIHALGGIYNIGNIPNDVKIGNMDLSTLSDYRYEGWAVGAGISYGYALPLGNHWNLEFEIGAGYVYTESDKFECVECGKKLSKDVPYHYVGPTKAAVSLVYLLF